MFVGYRLISRHLDVIINQNSAAHRCFSTADWMRIKTAMSFFYFLSLAFNTFSNTTVSLSMPAVIFSDGTFCLINSELITGKTRMRLPTQTWYIKTIKSERWKYTQTVHKYIFNNPQTQNVYQHGAHSFICSISTWQTSFLLNHEPRAIYLI